MIRRGSEMLPVQKPTVQLASAAAVHTPMILHTAKVFTFSVAVTVFSPGYRLAAR